MRGHSPWELLKVDTLLLEIWTGGGGGGGGTPKPIHVGNLH